jgi:hypothetical protein
MAPCEGVDGESCEVRLILWSDDGPPCGNGEALVDRVAACIDTATAERLYHRRVAAAYACEFDIDSNVCDKGPHTLQSRKG